MKKRIKMLSAIMAVLTVLCIVGSFSTFAEIKYTEHYYLYDYRVYGSVVTSSASAMASAYSENIGYGKAVKLKYYYLDGSIAKPVNCGNANTFVTNGFDTYSVSYDYESEKTIVYGANGEHKVKATQYIIWSSHDCENDSYVGRARPDYSDL